MMQLPTPGARMYGGINAPKIKLFKSLEINVRLKNLIAAAMLDKEALQVRCGEAEASPL
jgi:hypothetical protein